MTTTSPKPSNQASEVDSPKKLVLNPADGPLKVYIDTSVFRNLNLNLNHHAFLTVEKAIKSKEVVLLTNSILEGELAARAADLIAEEGERLAKFGVITSLYSEQVSQLRSELAKTTATTFLEAFKKRFTPENIDKTIDWKIVFSKHFACEAPFSTKKPNEFSDAFVIELLRDHVRPRLVLISTDSDYEKLSTSNKEILHFKGLAEFTNQFLKAKQEYEKFVRPAETALKSILEKVTKQLSDYYSDDGFYDVECFHSEIELANVTQLFLRTTELLEIDETEPTVVFRLVFRGETELDISSSVVVWDSIDKEEMHLGSNSKTGKVEIEIRCTLKVLLDINNPDQSEFEIEDDELSAETFQVPHEWTSFLDEEPEEDRD